MYLQTKLQNFFRLAKRVSSLALICLSFATILEGSYVKSESFVYAQVTLVEPLDESTDLYVFHVWTAITGSLIEGNVIVEALSNKLGLVEGMMVYLNVNPDDTIKSIQIPQSELDKHGIEK